MGIDLMPRHGGFGLRYNWAGWRGLRQLTKLDLPLMNDGEEIPAKVCEQIATIIEANAEWYNHEYGSPKEGGGYGEAPAAEHAEFWRNSTGVEVW